MGKFETVVLDVCDGIKDMLFLVFKISLQQGICHSILKIVKVTPLFKPGDPENVSDYRPISVLPVFSKVVERIM